MSNWFLHLNLLPRIHLNNEKLQHTDGGKGDNTEINSIVKGPPLELGIRRSSNGNNNRHHKRRNDQLLQRDRQTGTRKPSKPING